MLTKVKIVYLNSPENTTVDIQKRTVLFLSLNNITQWIYIALVIETQEIFESILDKIVFISRAKRFGTMEVQFKNEKNCKNVCI